MPATALLCSFLGAATANAQSTACYTTESLQGSWVLVTTYGSNVGMAVAQGTLDAEGRLNRTFTNNAPSPGTTTGERTIATGTNVGTYEVNCDGTGIFTRVLTSSTGVTANQFDDFLITASIEKDGKLIATQITDAVRVPSTLVQPGIFVSRVHTRRPDARPGLCYTLESLQGNYAVTVQYAANLAIGLQPENLDGEGNLFRAGINNQPLAGSPTAERTVGNVTSRGTYAVNCNGTGTITRLVTRPDGTSGTAVDDFVITGAIEKDERLIATSLQDAQRTSALLGPEAIMVTRTHVLRPNPNAQLESRLQSLACGTQAPAASCSLSVNIWNYFLVSINSKALPLVSGGRLAIHEFAAVFGGQGSGRSVERRCSPTLTSLFVLSNLVDPKEDSQC